jgi:hypothetical protein
MREAQVPNKLGHLEFAKMPGKSVIFEAGAHECARDGRRLERLTTDLDFQKADI